jgi:cysteine-rich repeat protein
LSWVSFALQQAETTSPESIQDNSSPQSIKDGETNTVYKEQIVNEEKTELWITPPKINKQENEPQKNTPQEDDNEQLWELTNMQALSDELHKTTPSETQKTVLETIYEQPWVIKTEWNDRVTVLKKAELTVIIPENTSIRKAEGNETVSVDDLLLLPEVTENIEKSHTWQEPVPLDTETMLAPEVITITNEWEVIIDPTEFIIPDETIPDETIPDETIPDATILDATTPDETIPDETIPDETIPDETIPDETIPDETIPDETIPDEKILQEDEQIHLTTHDIQKTIQKQAEGKEILQEVFEFGLPWEHLLFSEPVTLSYAVPYPEGSRIEVLVKHAGDIAPWVHWLSTDNSTSCTPDWFSTKWGNLTEVIWGKVTFLTCGASTFIVTYTWWASTPNFVDNGTKDYTWVVLTWVNFPTWSVLWDVNILINFRPIDNESPTGPRWTTNCYPTEKSFLLIHPDGTTVALANAGTYTTPTTTCPQAQILYDQSAPSGIIGWAWNLTGQSRQPVGNLSTLNGKSPFGTWTLRMWDSAAADGALLFGFQLILKNVECGDGLIWTGEACDDWDTNNNNWCSASCTIEAGRQCTGQPSVCTVIPTPSWLRLHYDGSMTWTLFQDIAWSWFNGTNVNWVTTWNQNGETVMCFNGTTQYIERATNLVTAYPFTMSTWIKTDTIGVLWWIMSFARSTATNIMRNIEHNNATPRVNGQNTIATYTNASTALNTTRWFLVTAVYTSAISRQIYINGVLEWTNTTNVAYSSNASNRLNIWRLADSTPSNFYDGCVDDVRFYSTALSSGQIYTLYAKPAALTTSFTTNASPLLTGTIKWALDTITLTISGNIYTGTNNGNGTWTLNAGIISPWLVNGTYPTTLTVTNPYGRSVQYTSAFTVTLPTGDFCIASPSSIAFPSFTTASSAQTWFTTSSWYFQLIDSSGVDSGYYTTLQITQLSWTSTSISNTWIARQSTGIVLLSWTANTGVVLWSAFTSYSVASGTVTFIKRDPAPNWWKKWTYWAPLQLRISLPAYIRPGTYTGTITYTLYEN